METVCVNVVKKIELEKRLHQLQVGPLNGWCWRWCNVTFIEKLNPQTHTWKLKTNTLFENTARASWLKKTFASLRCQTKSLWSILTSKLMCEFSTHTAIFSWEMDGASRANDTGKAFNARWEASLSCQTTALPFSQPPSFLLSSPVYRVKLL